VRPLVAIPGRFSATASALRYRALVTSRALLDAVDLAGGEPVTVLPADPNRVGYDVATRLRFADAVLLPGGSDISPARYGQSLASEHVYDIDDEQDSFDLAVACWALDNGVPLLAICRGMQVVNVALGGTLLQHMEQPHHHHVHEVSVVAGTRLAAITGNAPEASCYHHQRIDALGRGLTQVASSNDGGVEGIERPDSPGWFLGVQWHPEDTFTADPKQASVFGSFVAATLERILSR